MADGTGGKNGASMTIVIMLVIVCIVLSVSTVGVVVTYSSTINDLNQRLSNKDSQFNSMNDTINQLESQLNNLTIADTNLADQMKNLTLGIPPPAIQLSATSLIVTYNKSSVVYRELIWTVTSISGNANIPRSDVYVKLKNGTTGIDAVQIEIPDYKTSGFEYIPVTNPAYAPLGLMQIGDRFIQNTSMYGIHDFITQFYLVTPDGSGVYWAIAENL